MKMQTFLKYVGYKCEFCGATSPVQKWTLVEGGKQCPVCEAVNKDKKEGEQ